MAFSIRRTPTLTRTYEKSQKHTIIELSPTPDLLTLTAKLVHIGDALEERQFAGQALLDALNVSCHLPICALTVANRRQTHRHDGQHLTQKTYGYYRCTFTSGQFEKGTIRIYHKTAVREQVIAPKVFLNTLLHEWVHHFDYTKIKLVRSYHTAGFYARLRNLSTTLDVPFLVPKDPAQ